jgi:hypothetical protein
MKERRAAARCGSDLPTMPSLAVVQLPASRLRRRPIAMPATGRPMRDIGPTMTREESWNVDLASLGVLRGIAARGFAVSVSRSRHAFPPQPPPSTPLRRNSEDAGA